MLALAQGGPYDASGPDEIEALDRVAIEHANIRVALRWALTNDQAEQALRSGTWLFRFWERRGHFQEGCGWLEQALALPSAADVGARDRSAALNALAFLYWRGGDAARATPLAEEALNASRSIGNTRGTAQALLNLGMAAYLQHDYDVAAGCLEQSVTTARAEGAPPLLSVALTFLGRTLFWIRGAGDPRVLAIVEEGLAVAEAADSHYAAGHALATLGDVVWAQGNAHRALSLWRRALAVVCELDDRRGIAGCLERLGLVLATRGQMEDAAWLLGAADGQHTALGILRRDDDAVDHAHFVAASEQAKLRERCTDAWLAGQAAPIDESIDRAFDLTSV
jgi:non-specific serine/threonine protein kinase